MVRKISLPQSLISALRSSPCRSSFAVRREPCVMCREPCVMCRESCVVHRAPYVLCRASCADTPSDFGLPSVLFLHAAPFILNFCLNLIKQFNFVGYWTEETTI